MQMPVRGEVLRNDDCAFSFIPEFGNFHRRKTAILTVKELWNFILEEL